MSRNPTPAKSSPKLIQNAPTAIAQNASPVSMPTNRYASANHPSRWSSGRYQRSASSRTRSQSHSSVGVEAVCCGGGAGGGGAGGGSELTLSFWSPARGRRHGARWRNRGGVIPRPRTASRGAARSDQQEAGG